MRNHGHNSPDIKSPAAPQGEKRKLQRRLEQLKSTMGESEPATVIPITAPSATRMQADIGHSTRKLVLVSGLSLLVGAGLMWFAVSPHQPATAPSRATQPAITSSKPVPSASEPIFVAATAAQPAMQPMLHQEQEVRALLERWRQAWSNREVDSYLGFYDPAYAPKGQSPGKWVASRRDKLAGDSQISIQMREIRVHSIDAQRIEVSFLQDYTAGNYKEVGRAKTIQLHRSPKGWRIVSEQQAVKRK